MRLLRRLTLKDWVVPFVSVSVWFAASAKKDADKAQQVLDNVGKAVDGWQQQIMASTANILDSLPQVVAGRVTIARTEAVQMPY